MYAKIFYIYMHVASIYYNDNTKLCVITNYVITVILIKSSVTNAITTLNTLNGYFAIIYLQ